MARILAVIAGILIVITGIVWLTWYLAYGISGGPPASTEVSGMGGEAHVHWSGDGAVRIEAETLADGIAALGFAQGVQHTWHLALWRQAAEGRLSAWFGSPVLAHDALATMLRLAEGARAAYASLPDEDRALLDAFSRGVNAALADRAIRKTDEFVVFGIDAEPWQPWHSIAVERLIAWLATPNVILVPAGDHYPAELDYDTAEFTERRQAFRRWLHLFGFEHAAVIGLAGENETLIHRQVYGATVQPLFQEAELHISGYVIQGASLIGTPFFLIGRSPELAWSVLMHSDAALETLPPGSRFPEKTFGRIEQAGGGESVVSFRMAENYIVLAEPRYTVPTLAEPPIRRLRWDGLRDVSDASAWFQLLKGSAAPAFSLFSGAGAVAAPGLAPRPVGPQQFHATTTGGVVISPDADARREIAQRIRSGLAGAEPSLLVNDVFSAWAQEVLAPMLDGVDTTFTHSRTVEEAMMYLRNWDHAFDAASIGASIFDAWYQALLMLPLPTFQPFAVLPDTAGPFLHPEVSRNYRALFAALERLEAMHGTDKSRWRWEEVQPNRRYYPVFSDTTLASEAGRRMNRTRYAPISLSGSGHPTTVRYGPSTDPSEPPAPSVWIGWMDLKDNEPLHYMKDHADRQGFLSRYLVEGRSAEIRRLTANDGRMSTTKLTPAGR